MNVELTPQDHKMIEARLAPLSRLAGGSDTSFDVVLRQMRQQSGMPKYYASMRFTAGDKKYYAVASDVFLTKAVSKMRDDVRRSISKQYRSAEFHEDRMQRYLRERQYVELFV